mgnify:CR=1 FL=1
MSETVKAHVIEVIQKTNKNGDPFWDIKAEVAGRERSFRDRVPRVEWTKEQWYEVELADRQPIPDRPGQFYLAEVVLAELLQAPPGEAPPGEARAAIPLLPATNNSYWSPEREERIMRGNALNAAAAALGPLIAIESTWQGYEDWSHALTHLAAA